MSSNFVVLRPSQVDINAVRWTGDNYDEVENFVEGLNIAVNGGSLYIFSPDGSKSRVLVGDFVCLLPDGSLKRISPNDDNFVVVENN